LAKTAGGAAGAAEAGLLRAIEHEDVLPAAGRQVIRGTRPHDAAADDDDRGVLHVANTSSGFLKLLNSSALPLGSRKNIVACSPGWPVNRVRGSMTNDTPAARTRPASAWNSSHDRMAPKCGIGTAMPSTSPLFCVGVTLPVVCAEIWLPKKSKSTHTSVERPSRQPRTSP